RLLHVKNVFGQKHSEVASLNGHFMVLGTVARSGESRVGPLVDDLGIREADGVSADRSVRFPSSKAQHCGRIHAATQQKTDRNIADHVQADGFVEWLHQAGLRLSWVDRGGLEAEIPILAILGPSFAQAQRSSRPKLPDVAE